MSESVLTEKYLTRFSIYHDNQEGKIRIIMKLIIDAWIISMLDTNQPLEWKKTISMDLTSGSLIKNLGISLFLGTMLFNLDRISIFVFSKGPDALDWQNLCGPTKNLDKICLCQICQGRAHWDKQKYLLTTSVNHTEINTIACTLFAEKVTWDLRSPLRSNMFPRHIIACILLFFSLEFVQLQQRQLLLLLC